MVVAGCACLFFITAFYDGLVSFDQCNELGWILKMVDEGLRAEYVAYIDKVEHISLYEPL